MPAETAHRNEAPGIGSRSGDRGIGIGPRPLNQKIQSPQNHESDNTDEQPGIRFFPRSSSVQPASIRVIRARNVSAYHSFVRRCRTHIYIYSITQITSSQRTGDKRAMILFDDLPLVNRAAFMAARKRETAISRLLISLVDKWSLIN